MGGSEPRHMIEVVEAVVIIMKHSIGVPHIAGGPVVHGRCGPHIFELAADPAGVLVAAFPVKKTPVALEGFIGPNTQKAHGLFIPMAHAVPPAKLPGQIFLVHLIAVGGDGVIAQVDHIGMLWHGANPSLLLFIVPRIPVHLIVTQSRPGSHGKTNPVWLHLLFNAGKGAFNILRGDAILSFKVLVKYPNAPVGVILLSKVQHQVQKQSAVFPTGKRDKNVLKFLKYKMQAALQSFVYILIQILSLHRLTRFTGRRKKPDLHIIGQILANFNIFPGFSKLPAKNRPRY